MNRKVWRTSRAGAIDRLRLMEEALPELLSGTVRIETKAVGLNFADIFALTGLYSATPQGSFIPGLEFSGVVQTTGSETTSFRAGDRIMGVTRFGGYSSVIDIEPAYCVPIPGEWSFAQGAAFLAQTLTAWYALKELGNIQPGRNVLIQSAAGGVGLRAMQICRKVGATPIGTVRNSAKKEFLRQLGFEKVIIRDRDFSLQVKQQLNGGDLHLVLEAIGGNDFRRCYDLLAPTGRLIVFGAAEFTPGKNRPRYIPSTFRYLRRPKLDPLRMISDNKSVMAFNLIWLWSRLDVLGSLLNEIQALQLDPPFVGKEFPFHDAPAALEFLRSGQSVGKVVLIL